MSNDVSNRLTRIDFTGTLKEPAQLDGATQQHQPLQDTKKETHPPLSKKISKVIKGGPKALGLPQVSENAQGSHSCIVRYESPWDTYRRTISCIIAGKVIIATHHSNPSRVIAIREYQKRDADKMVELYSHLKHENILSARECFMDERSMFALVDDLPLTLEHLVGCRTFYPSECELASMLWQTGYLLMCKTLNGACYLSENGWEHQSMICQCILLGLDGAIKIANLESCERRSPSQTQSKHIKSLAGIAMELMQKYIKDNGMVGVDDLGRWPVDSAAFGFLLAISTATSMEALKEHSLFINKNRSRGRLVLLARTVMLSAKICYSHDT
ncbi:hypothetical protein N7530_009734 [Penicillium desertorum]|uniref:Protein kinase domain-containing protein n=1 Tax=Penicillium desertorum TaxID=1303715 RepID=A0A9W9WJ06_9EURO|nr:hypothetical protein N7530_009734 [Penicillium desertorum]